MERYKTQRLRKEFSTLVVGATEDDDLRLLARVLDIILQSYPGTQLESGWFMYYIRTKESDFDIPRVCRIINHLLRINPVNTKNLMYLLGSFVEYDVEPHAFTVDLLVNSGMLDSYAIRLARSIRIFISYAHEDNVLVEGMKKKLETYQQLQIWKDSQDLLPGQMWDTEIRQALIESQYVVMCLSQYGLTKGTFFKTERECAMQEQARRGAQNLFVIPVRLDDCAIPDDMRALQWVDLFTDWDEGIAKVIQSLFSGTKRQAP
jgi:hypothetical protein